jgi:hypothetical protein
LDPFQSQLIFQRQKEKQIWGWKLSDGFWFHLDFKLEAESIHMESPRKKEKKAYINT